MAGSQEQLVADPSLLAYFGLTRPPFAALTEPSQLFPAEQYSLLTEHLAGARKHADYQVVVCGADGSGKSTLLNHFLASLDRHSLFIVLNDTCQSAEQFYCEFLKQIGFEDISGSVDELHNITREFLRHRGNDDDHVLIAIDNAHQVNPAVLEQLRRISEIKVEDRRVLSVVLTGSNDLLRVIDAPAMKRTKFRSRVVFGIRGFTEEETASYVWHCLRLAGQNNGVNLPKEAHALIHRYSGGIPHQINKLCNDLLAEAHSLKSRVITEKIVRTVADKLQLVPHVAPMHGKGRRETDPDFNRMRSVPVSELDTEAGKSSTDEPDKVSMATVADVDPEHLHQQVAQLSKQADDLRADKMRALRDIDERNKDISQLRNELGTKTSEIESLKRFLDINVAKIDQQNQALSQSVAALQDRESTSEKLAADLKEESRRREAAESELVQARATIDELSQLQQELQAQLKVADERAAQIEVFEANAADLKNELEGKTGELDSRNKDLADIEKQLEQSRDECVSAKRRIAALKSPDELQKLEAASDRLAADLEKETRTRAAVESELAKAEATVNDLTQLKQGLQVTVDELQAQLKVADERAVEIKALEQNAADLKNELEGKTGELVSLREEVESRNRDLAAELEEETRARELAESELVEVKGTVDELKQLKQELQATADDLQARLKVANERSVKLEVLEKNTADLEDEIEGKVGELDSLRKALESRDQACADLQARLEVSQNECEKLRRRAAAADSAEKSVEESVADADISAPACGTGIHSSHVVARFDESLRQVPAYQTILDYDPAFYASLIDTYKELIGLDHTDKQVKDALRTRQANLIEELLPRASDEAIVSYARSIVDQLKEFQHHGMEPCFTLLVPKSDPNISALPVYSDNTKEDELKTLDLTLRSYDANRLIPTEEEVWPDLEPIFEELFEAYGKDAIAAIQDDYDPGIGRLTSCEISRALYSEILGLSQPKAARALRWILSP